MKRKVLLSEIIKTCENELIINNFKDIEIEGIDRDSRLIKENYIFCAVDGMNLKGATFIEPAIKNGAKVIVTETDYKNENIIVMKTKEKNLKDIYGKLLKQFYNNLPEHIIGVTGTSGKTSVVEFLRQAIELLGYESASIGTLGIKYKEENIKSDTLTMKETSDLYEKLYLLKSEKNVNYVSMEFTSQGLDQKRAVGVHPEIGIFTNITPEHLDYHKTMEEYFNKKMLLFKEALNKGSTAIINADIPEFEKIKKVCRECNHKIISYGYNGDIKIKNIENNLQGQKVYFEYLGKEYLLNTKFMGHFQVMNLLSVFGALVELNIEKDISKIIKSLENIKNAEGRMEFVGKKKNGAQIYIDFAHKSDALQKILETMRDHMKNEKKGRLFVLFGCGGDRDKEKRQVMGQIANKLADVVFITDDNPRNENPDEIRNEILKGCPKAYNIAGRENAIKEAFKMLEENDILILAGKGHEKYIIINKEKIPFDEKKIVQECINNES